jgi:hypothetical protein
MPIQGDLYTITTDEEIRSRTKMFAYNQSKCTQNDASAYDWQWISKSVHCQESIVLPIVGHEETINRNGGDGARRAASWRVRRKPRAKEAGPTRRLGETRRTRLELDEPFGVLGRVNVDDSVAAVPHTPHRTRSRVGSRGPV